ncbi:MAG: hypothetical protein KME20_27055 [Kaiparowitsia implicata GSE-PSE-MK54-09C]|nr:hypothetical protein [Kaiparowitsia implicata GSE-PSE-MK54-09C]
MAEVACLRSHKLADGGLCVRADSQTVRHLDMSQERFLESHDAFELRPDAEQHRPPFAAAVLLQKAETVLMLVRGGI